ncbi:endonuclease/exonuclease/phosphatase family protein [Kutzneria albida]|uniref:Endonuclease/exonuclease/phosphatase domain-containing protein n=1 Tax=Kutzneria albida DSM 43870 TaxID=1449976 RepID=W5WK53_9PSEU|nr:endonuclease/exonuclease/phosphatase family protein [Kutzneria albida]AHH98559.1 hypothetical protein KALB_5197 [Kutzneria albida DSM 43870]
MSKATQDFDVRMVHWNIHSWLDDAGGSNLEAVEELLQATEPHVVSLVEVDEEWSQPSALDELAARCGYASVFAPAFEFGGDEPRGGFGNAVLTKLPILAVRQRQLVWPTRTYDGSEPSEPRSVVFVKVQAPAGAIWTGSTHLPRSEAETRAGAARRLMAIAGGLDGCWALCGDFNMPASAWASEYPDLAVEPSTGVPTYPTAAPDEAIDYCLAGPGVNLEAEVLSRTGSDHLPILVRARVVHG